MCAGALPTRIRTRITRIRPSPGRCSGQAQIVARKPHLVSGISYLADRELRTANRELPPLTNPVQKR